MTIAIGSWGIPLAVTLAVWLAVILWPTERGHGYGAVGDAATGLLKLAIAVPVSLIAWRRTFERLRRS
ncbi:hypothetical protein ASF36_23385 [Methylobacterium sp. Leaf90]|nr:hypothetical protein ASF36_23385 [Methylobacterium sp. Leaf90]